MPAPYDAMDSAYAAALAGSRLAASTRAAYRRRAGHYLAWLALQDGPGLRDMGAAVAAAHAYRRHLAGRYATRTINSVMAAVEDFHARLGLGATGVPRETAPKSLAQRTLVHTAGHPR
ncbi:site-specific integrase [Nonomuraea sp. NN258]|nr:site-specific integrase [Nonomuraea antri]